MFLTAQVEGTHSVLDALTVCQSSLASKTGGFGAVSGAAGPGMCHAQTWAGSCSAQCPLPSERGGVGAGCFLSVTAGCEARAASRLTVKACLQGLPPVQSSCRACSGSAGREQRARCTASGEVREYQSVSFFPLNTPRPTHTSSCPAFLQGLGPGTGSALMTFLSSHHWHCGISAAGELRPSLHPSLEQQRGVAVILCLSKGEREPVY